MSVEEVVERYLAYRRAAGSEYVCGAQRLRRVASLLGKSADAGALAGANIEELILADGHMTLTSRMRLSSLSVFLRWCVARGFLAGMPRLPEPLRNLHPARPHIFSDDEIRRLLSANHMRRHSRSRIPVETARMALLLTCAMGLRIGETLSLTVGDIDTDRNVATIRETKFYKTRIVPFNSAVAQKLGDFVIWRKNSGLPVTVRNCSQKTRQSYRDTYRMLFAHLSGRCGKPVDELLVEDLSHDGILSFLELVVRYAEIASRQFPAIKDKRPSPHTIRHTTVTHLPQAGVDINTVRAWLGHSSVETTNIYAVVGMEAKIEVIGKCLPARGRKRTRHRRTTRS